MVLCLYGEYFRENMNFLIRVDKWVYFVNVSMLHIFYVCHKHDHQWDITYSLSYASMDILLNYTSLMSSISLLGDN
jgi:hypothetical protein